MRQSEGDTAIYNADDPQIATLLPIIRANRVPFSVSQPVDGAYISSGFVCFRGAPVIETAELDFAGRELEDVLAAVAVAFVKAVSAYTVASALTSFRRPDFRRKPCGSVSGVEVFNDSKATNVYSTVSATESMEGDTVLILGGADRGEDFGELFRMLPKTVKGIVVTGENADKVLDSARLSGFCPARRSAGLADACADALDMAHALGCRNVLFSPSSKSYDNYSSYTERGREFDAVVARLKDKK